MNTLKVHEILMENPKARFHRKNCNLEYFFEDGQVKFKSKGEPDSKGRVSCDSWADTDDWELVRQPVTWQEAIQAWIDGRNIYVEFEQLGNNVKYEQWHMYKFGCFGEGRHGFEEKCFRSGKWFIE